ncbi:MAG TPA: glycosyltransferase family 2 protein [Opitutaceae bacterium]|nr:glycosyltransferase family 2 protein [Opitutaceae bacterium]
MINGLKICAVLPAYNAARTLEKTVAAIDRTVVDEILVVDDASTDQTREITVRLGVSYAFHGRNVGYGANQKTCYALALASGADIVVMLHPDYQYEPRLLPSLAGMLASGVYEVAIGSRILGRGALQGGMPLYKYVSNRALTFGQNLLIGQKLSEYHTGYRAFARKVLMELPLLANSDDFVFDNQMLVQCHRWGFRIAEISCPTAYFPEASSINFRRSVRYGFGVLAVSVAAAAGRLGLPGPAYLDRSRAAQFRISAQALRDRIVETNVPGAG